MKFFGKLVTGTFAVLGVFFSTAKITAYLKSKMTDKDSDDLFKQHINCPQSMIKGWTKNDPSYIKGTEEYEAANKTTVEYVKYIWDKIKEKITDITTARKELNVAKEKISELEKINK